MFFLLAKFHLKAKFKMIFKNELIFGVSNAKSQKMGKIGDNHQIAIFGFNKYLEVNYNR